MSRSSAQQTQPERNTSNLSTGNGAAQHKSNAATSQHRPNGCSTQKLSDSEEEEELEQFMDAHTDPELLAEARKDQEGTSLPHNHMGCSKGLIGSSAEYAVVERTAVS